MFWCFEPWWRASFLRNYLFHRRDLMKRLMRRVPISVEYNFMKKPTGRIRLFISFQSTRVILLWFSGTLFINLTQVLLWCSDASSLDDEPWWRALMTSLDGEPRWRSVMKCCIGRRKTGRQKNYCKPSRSYEGPAMGQDHFSHFI